MYYINLIAETEKREKEQQQRSKDGHRADRPPQDRRRPRPDTAPGADDRLGSSRKGRNKHGKEKKKKKTSFSSDKKSEKAKRKRPRQPEASSAPSSSSGLSCGGNGLIDDEELLIERR
ncbi:hypothetical protein Pmar_PMAR018545 [Perkinsus marinus ATCC 50983]|uniref:Uncharacterized protein n=1 Tax=Perkinsus marinus (strain ATCC 50983 / TXsc) TaxID=423536 RepID=C5L043_PERM5|nr:hypothetical protein Pmar_PMAR018545 [Perkinsus marinus ATCC 50983]EER09901.1 hypothetical protein Pmar_PMAR018545 [Perkinsus marinus ATCC 50983]|eukprot:XP_002778106.1 hypothetical protein Pmar_PMAR018545 [Perkinsus marinus ATCC 50983]